MLKLLVFALLSAVGCATSFELDSLANFLSGSLKAARSDFSLESADQAARILLSLFNSSSVTTTISATTGLLLILGISFGLFVVFMLIYFSVTSIAAPGLVGKRSLPDGDEGISGDWLNVLQLLGELEEHFHRTTNSDDDECRSYQICSVTKQKNHSNHLENGNSETLFKLAAKLSGTYARNTLTEPNPQLRVSSDKIVAYHEAFKHGQANGNCEEKFQKCSKLL